MQIYHRNRWFSGGTFCIYKASSAALSHVLLNRASLDAQMMIITESFKRPHKEPKDLLDDILAQKSDNVV